MQSGSTAAWLRNSMCGVRLALTIFVACTPANAAAQESGATPPLPMNNRTPFTLVQMAPTAPDYTMPNDDHQISARIDLSSHSLIESAGDSQIELDGETMRVALNWQFRPSGRWIVGATVPWISHGGGFLDSLIDGWHNITGLPDGERDRQPGDRLLFGFQNDRQTLVTRNRQQGIGDMVINSAFQVHTTGPVEVDQRAAHSSWVQLGIKLSTGSANRLTGSGATDIAASFHHIRQWQLTRPWSLSIDAFALRTQQGDLIETQKKNQWQLNVKTAVQWTDRIAPEAQLRYRSAAYDNPLAALGGDSIGLDVGITLSARSGYWKLGFSEDLDIDSAPDVGFYAQYTHRPDR